MIGKANSVTNQLGSDLSELRLWADHSCTLVFEVGEQRDFN
jgi:hypothetical protein